MPARTLFFALDACEVRTARHLAAEGRMPTLARLLDTASSVDTQAPPVGTYVSATWPTLWTARRLQRHGYTCWLELELADDHYDFRHTTPRSVQGEPFWIALSDAGRRVAVLDAPHSWADERINGAFLAEWASHDRHFGTTSWPPELEADVVARFGRHPVAGVDHDQARQFAPCDWTLGGPFRDRDADEARRLRDQLLAGLETKERASLDLLGREDWDLFFTVVGETHCVGHQFWFLHEKAHERYDADLAGQLGDPVADVYSRADAVLARHIDAAGPDANVFVLLSHGMGAHHGGSHLFDAVLRRLGEHWRDGYRGRAAVTSAKRVWDRVPIDWRRRAHGAVAVAARQRLRQARPSPVAIGPLADEPFLVFPNNDTVGAVRLNVIGREPSGVIRPEDFDAAREQLATDLLDLVNVATGEPVVQRIVTATSALPGADPARLADLYAVWNYRSQIELVYSPKLGMVEVPYTHVRSGDHRPEGLLLATGPGIAPFVSGDRVGVEHIAPTVARTLDVDLVDVDGTPIDAILRTTTAGAA